MPDATWIVTTIIALVGVGAAVWRVHVERQRNKVLRAQLELAEQSALPRVELTDLHPTGGGSAIDFTVYAQNIGGRPTRAVVTASIAGEVVYESERLNLLVNTAPIGVMIRLPRPTWGELMPECGHATTLYGQTLVVTADAEGQLVEVTWEDTEYDPQTDRARWEVQQRYWRQGRGKETPQDLRNEVIARHEERRDTE